MGRFRTSMMSMRSSNSHPRIVPARMATRHQMMRQRSSSRWSRNGISPRAVIFGEAVGRLLPEALLVLPREIGLRRPRVGRNHPTVVVPRRGLVAPLLGEAAQLVQRGCSARRMGIALHKLIVHRSGRIGSRLLEAFANIVQRISSPLVRRVDPQELAEAKARGGGAAATVLL